VVQPVQATHAQQNIGGAYHGGNHSNHFSYPDDRGAPGYPQQMQDTRYEGAGITDADEENKVGDIDAPHDIIAHTGYNMAINDLHRKGINACKDEKQHYRKPYHTRPAYPHHLCSKEFK
jgi:hypothetical protein